MHGIFNEYHGEHDQRQESWDLKTVKFGDLYSQAPPPMILREVSCMHSMKSWLVNKDPYFMAYITYIYVGEIL